MPISITRLAIIGNRGHMHYVLQGLPLIPHVRVVGLADGGEDDPAAPVAHWCEANGHQPQTFSNWRRMLDTVRADAVVVCGAFDAHAEMSIDVINRELPLFVEKPVGMNHDQLSAVREAHAKHPQVHVATMMASRYEPGIFTAWNLVRSGAIGDVRLLNARKSYKLGQRASYFHRRETYGGTIPWVTVHAIDWILWFTIGESIESIYATHSIAHNGGNGTMERAAMCQLQISGDRSASISSDVFRPANAPTHGDDWLRIVGTTGVLEARPRSLTVINQTSDGTTPISIDSDRQVFKDFIDHAEGRSVGLINAAQTFTLTQACLLARDSADAGGKILRGDFDSPLRYSAP